MSFDADALAKLLPAIYRIRDSEQGGALRDLLSVIAGQIGILEEDLAQLYDDQFIETCADWVIPYIGDAIGYQALHGSIPGISSPRADAANTISYRRRKGTAPMLEQMAGDVTSWPARVVEYFQLLATTQHMNHIRPDNEVTPNLRDWELVEYANTPFNRIPHTADVRCIATRAGKYNIPNIGVHLWRLHPYRLKDSPACSLGDGRYRFNPLGIDTQLFTEPPVGDEGITRLAEPINVPMPISRRTLEKDLSSYYGDGKSMFIKGCTDLSKIVIRDLSDSQVPLAEMPEDDDIAIDPKLGRFAFGPAASVPSPLQVSFHYGFCADMGGGEYPRDGTFDEVWSGSGESTPKSVPTEYPTITDAIGYIEQHGGSGIVEVVDSGCYEEPLRIDAKEAGDQIVLRAASNYRPLLKMPTELQVSGSGKVVINGFVISGAGIHVDAGLETFSLRHCTLVPGLTLKPNGDPEQPGALSLTCDLLFDDDIAGSLPTAEIVIDHCITGPIQAIEGTEVEITDSIVDACARDRTAYSGDGTSGGELHIENSTVIGGVQTILLTYASNTIFLSPVTADQLQSGCVRFCFIPYVSAVPRRYRCQPNLAEQQAVAQAEQAAVQAKLPAPTEAEEDVLTAGVDAWLKPMFTTLRYGHPAYCQLSCCCPEEIRTGADDGAEMGAYHSLYQPQREINLNVRLEEYLRFGLVAGIFHET